MQVVEFLVLNLALLIVAPNMRGPHGVGARVYTGYGTHGLPGLNRAIDQWNAVPGFGNTPLEEARGHTLLSGDLLMVSDSSVDLIFSYDRVRLFGQGWQPGEFDGRSSYSSFQVDGDFIAVGLQAFPQRKIPIFITLKGGFGWSTWRHEIIRSGSWVEGSRNRTAFLRELEGAGMIGEIGAGGRLFLTSSRTLFTFAEASYCFRNLPVGRDSIRQTTRPPDPRADDLQGQLDLDFSGAALKIGIGRVF